MARVEILKLYRDQGIKKDEERMNTMKVLKDAFRIIHILEKRLDMSARKLNTSDIEQKRIFSEFIKITEAVSSYKEDIIEDLVHTCNEYSKVVNHLMKENKKLKQCIEEVQMEEFSNNTLLNNYKEENERLHQVISEEGRDTEIHKSEEGSDTEILESEEDSKVEIKDEEVPNSEESSEVEEPESEDIHPIKKPKHDKKDPKLLTYHKSKACKKAIKAIKIKHFRNKEDHFIKLFQYLRKKTKKTIIAHLKKNKKRPSFKRIKKKEMKELVSVMMGEIFYKIGKEILEREYNKFIWDTPLHKIIWKKYNKLMHRRRRKKKGKH